MEILTTLLVLALSAGTHGQGAVTDFRDGFVLLSRHRDVSLGFFSPDVITTGVENPLNSSANTYSIIGIVDAALFRIDQERYEFELVYTYADQTQDILRWSQESWITEDTVTGADLSAVNDAFAANPVSGFNGLARSSLSNSYLDGTPNSAGWFHAVAAVNAYNGGIPGHNQKVAYHSELWVHEATDCTGDVADASCCTSAAPCGLYGGGCSFDNDCAGGLICGVDNCNSLGLGFPDETWNCCVPPTVDNDVRVDFSRLCTPSALTQAGFTWSGIDTLTNAPIFGINAYQFCGGLGPGYQTFYCDPTPSCRLRLAYRVPDSSPHYFVRIKVRAGWNPFPAQPDAALTIGHTIVGHTNDGSPQISRPPLDVERWDYASSKLSKPVTDYLSPQADIVEFNAHAGDTIYFDQALGVMDIYSMDLHAVDPILAPGMVVILRSSYHDEFVRPAWMLKYNGVNWSGCGDSPTYEGRACTLMLLGDVIGNLKIEQRRMLSSFVVVPGLSGTGISLRSLHEPDKYVVATIDITNVPPFPYSETNYLGLRRLEDSDDFRRDATWIPSKESLDGHSTGVSLSPLLNTNKFWFQEPWGVQGVPHIIRLRENEYTSDFGQEATFRVEATVPPQLTGDWKLVSGFPVVNNADSTVTITRTTEVGVSQTDSSTSGSSLTISSEVSAGVFSISASVSTEWSSYIERTSESSYSALHTEEVTVEVAPKQQVWLWQWVMTAGDPNTFSLTNRFNAKVASCRPEKPTCSPLTCKVDSTTCPGLALL